MARQQNGFRSFSRRAFLGRMRWAPLLFVPAPLCAAALAYPGPEGIPFDGLAHFPFADLRLSPRYPAKSPLDDVLRQVAAGSDEFVTEKYAAEIEALLGAWASNLRVSPPALDALAKFIDPDVAATSLRSPREDAIRSAGAIEVVRRNFSTELTRGRGQFLESCKEYFDGFSALSVAAFEIVSLRTIPGSALAVRAEIRYELVGPRGNGALEQRIGRWLTQWNRDDSGAWRAVRWEAAQETLARAPGPVFQEVTAQAFARAPSYSSQMRRGVDHWRTVLDGACGIDVYGNNGLALGDIDNDGFDDLYVCQPAGLPNRLYHNRGDGTFDDVTEQSGVGVLDATACALFADFRNSGVQDLLVICGSGPLLFLNQGEGRFTLKRDAFRFAQPPQGTFTHAAVADYDRDGRLDIYFCLYSYYLGLDQYRYPVPYFDARNGPPNFLLHNDGDGTFVDRTAAAGLHAENDRYSFACAWGDCNGDGAPDLYVANDFGRSNLYRNNGDGTFAAISAEAGVDDPGAGMSACLLDFDGDGRQDIYVANMWSAAGMRVSEQEIFQDKAPEAVRELYRRHARGNSLYRNMGTGKFQNIAAQAGVQIGRWAWCSDAWDFDHDGNPDLYIANGYISALPDTLARDTAAKPQDVASFFWRQVVAKSPENATPSTNYERGWNAINELIRSDFSWNGAERNVFYRNNGDGTFSDVSGVVGLDFPDDSRAFALADLDHDGRLEVALKNRTAPQLRVLRNAMQQIGNAVVIRLRGTKSNRDAIGAAVTVETGGPPRTRYLQAGSGFLAQHTKELFFGLGKANGDASGPVRATVRATVRWPNGLSQTFEHLPLNHRIKIEEGSGEFLSEPFASPSLAYLQPAKIQQPEPSSAAVHTWLIEPLPAPDFALPDTHGTVRSLASFRGGFVLLNFGSTRDATSREQLRLLQKEYAALAARDVRILAVDVAADPPPEAAHSSGHEERFSFPILLATPEVAGIYNIVYRYLFDRRRDLPIPASFLIDAQGLIVKVYQGAISPDRVLQDVQSANATADERTRLALPFPGTLYQGRFARNAFTYGVAFFQHGYLDQAAASFQHVVAAQPENAEAYYNLGTLYLRRNLLADARRYLEQALKINRDYPEAWNNLGMIAAQEGRAEEATHDFQESLRQRPTYTTALLNLGNLYRRQGEISEAEKVLARALELAPDDPEANYSAGMLYAHNEDLPRAAQLLQRAVDLRPDYPDALNNLGVLLVREERYSEAKEQFEKCIAFAPQFDQGYLNLARLYVLLHDKEKAKEVLQALLRQQPQHKMAQQALEMLN